MQTTLCSRCGKNVAVIFVTRINELGQNTSEGLCLRCARELKIKPIDDILSQFGISEDELDNISGEMTSYMQGIDGPDPAEGTDDEEGKTSTMPLFGKLFNGLASQMRNMAQSQGPGPEGGTQGGEKQKTPHAAPPPAKEKSPGTRKYLNTYCIDLTQRARDGQLDAMIGREEELERVIQILNRRQKNNPCLIGEPGVGKTAIAEGLAQRIASGDVPAKLKDKEVFLLDLTALVAGTQFRGQFESRMKGLIQEIKKLGNIILVIDEMHTIVGAGDAEGSMNAANILKPALSRGEIQVIGATTFSEYRKHIEKDAALERRFQPVTVSEPSVEDSVKILQGIAHYYEDYHGVRIPDEMCRAAVQMSERYITDRFLPDKAIDLLDEACSDVNLKDAALNRALLVKKELEKVRAEQEALQGTPVPDTGGNPGDQDALNERYAKVAELRSRELQLEQETDALKDTARPALTLDNLARIIELWTKIPASTIKQNELTRLSGLNNRLKEHIIGQDEAVNAVSAAIKRSRVGMKTKRKPVSFIFVGGTGVGKTELVKRLAADLFDSPESLIRLDMSEFMEKFSVSRIIGSPPGYVGYDEAGQLTEKIRRKPYSVVLFDEIEKAHPDVMNILLQILDDGRITDAQGRTVSFENTVIIMTTNAGSNTKSGSVGFGGSLTDMSREKTMKALEEFLRPEFINRVDEVVCFNQLSEENFSRICVLMLEELAEVVAQRDMTLTWTPAVVEYLVKKGYSVTYGARNLRRLIQKEIEDVTAEQVIESGGNVSAISLDANEDGIVCKVS